MSTINEVTFYLIDVCDGLSIMTRFFAEFVHTYKGVTCSESGYMDLSTARECSGAVRYAKYFNSNARYRRYISEVHRDNYPKGCFIADEGSMYFNRHSTGERATSVASICMKGNM